MAAWFYLRFWSGLTQTAVVRVSAFGGTPGGAPQLSSFSGAGNTKCQQTMQGLGSGHAVFPPPVLTQARSPYLTSAEYSQGGAAPA